MDKITGEMIQKAKSVKNVQELLSLADENGIRMTGEEAESYYARLCITGELSDDDLDNVAGGGCGNSGSKPLTAANMPIGTHVMPYGRSHCWDIQKNSSWIVEDGCLAVGCNSTYFTVTGFDPSKELVTAVCGACGRKICAEFVAIQKL